MPEDAPVTTAHAPEGGAAAVIMTTAQWSESILVAVLQL
jgi:hypothetical protein